MGTNEENLSAEGKQEADACQRMLLDTDAGQRLAEFGAKSRENRSIVQDIKKWIREFMDRVRRSFRNVMPDSKAAQEFDRLDQQTKQILADMFVDMTLDAGEKLSTIKAAGMTEKITTDSGGVRFMARGGMEVTSFLVPRGNKVNTDLYIEDRLGTLLEDIRKHLPDLRSMDPVYELDGTEFQNNQSDIRSLKRKVKDFFDSIGNKVERKELGVIALNNAGAHDSLEHGYGPIKAACFAALPSVIEKGLMFGPNQYMDRSYDTYLFVAPVRFVGVEKGEFYVGAYVIRDVNTTRYKIHEVLTINKEGNRPFKPEADQNGEHLRDDSLPGSKIAQQEREVKEKDAEGAMSHKIPVSRDVADRGKLVDLFEQMVTSSNEYKVLENYRKHMQEMLDIEEHLERINEEIRRLSFAEGPRGYRQC